MSWLAMALLWITTGFMVLATLLPISKVPLGMVRGLDFPRQQIFLLAVVLSGATIIWHPGWLGGVGWLLLLVIAAVQLIYILKFTPLWRRQSLSVRTPEERKKSAQVSVLSANVKMSNRDYAPLIAQVRQHAPDLVLAIEVDADWIAGLKKELGALYETWVEVPRDTGYGMAILSKLPLGETEVRDIVTEGVPSIRTRVSLPNGEDFRLYMVHPEPPVIDQDTKGRDSEIALIGLEAAKDDLPALVAGDLNDVAWSTTTRRFQRLSGLLDPRVGRGFYNTFSATMPWMRWPLDHLFHDPRFRLVEMARLPKIGSDHFPMWFVLSLARTEAVGLDPGTSDAEEAMRAKRMIVEERNREREPIGTDWEDPA